MARTLILNFLYRDTPWMSKVEDACARWEKTPYKLNFCQKGVGVDCIHFVAAILDEMYGQAHSKNLRSLPPDACVHNRVGVHKAGKALFKAYPAIEKVMDGTLEAGDLVITGPRSETPTAGHLMIAGKRGKLWQSISTGVCFSGYGILDTEMLVSVYRASDKTKWLS